jgi:hypothetical protein
MARKIETPTETRPATFNLEDPTLKAIMAQAVATALAAQRAELLQAMAEQKPAKPEASPRLSVAGKSDRSIRTEIAVVRAFAKAGFGKVIPHQNVKTFNRWVAEGRRPIEGTKSLKVANLRLFHVSQTRPISKDELKAVKEQQSEAIKRHTAKVTPLHPGNPQ